MALDVGDKRIGIAVSDKTTLIALPYMVISRKNIKYDINLITNEIEKNSIQEIVIGLPKNMNGEIGEQSKKIIDFTKKLKKRINIPIIYWDERLSSKSAEKPLIMGKVNRNKRKKIIDKIAASIFLQSYLDNKKRRASDE